MEDGMTGKFKDIQQTLPKMRECQVCAMGACVLSLTKYENKLKFSDVGAASKKFTEDTDNLIKGVFSSSQLMIIETMFEGDDGETKYGTDRLQADVDQDTLTLCGDWSDDFPGTDTQKMKAIFEILINHGGEIDPNKL